MSSFSPGYTMAFNWKIQKVSLFKKCLRQSPPTLRNRDHFSGQGFEGMRAAVAGLSEMFVHELFDTDHLWKILG